MREFKGIIKEADPDAEHQLPSILNSSRGSDEITHVVAIDSSTVTERVQNGYPGAEAALFNLAAIVINLKTLREIGDDEIPGPQKMRDLEKCETLGAVLPGRNIVRRGMADDSPKRFFRATVQNEMNARIDQSHETLLETMRDITVNRRSARIDCPIGEECLETGENRWVFPSQGKSICNCQLKEDIYETDALRLHERFEESGSSEQAFTAFRQVVEHLSMVNIMRYFEKTNRLEAFRHTAFIIDGPLAIFSMPAWLKYYVGNEVARLHEKAQQSGGPGILLMGVEKSGRFLDHLNELDWKQNEGPRHRLPNGTALTPDIAYIHRYIALRPPDSKPYGSATYYGRHVLYKNRIGQHSVIMSPMVNDKGRNPNCTEESAYPRIGDALSLMDELATHLYRDGFTPLVRAHAHAAIPLRAGGRILSEIFDNP